MQNKNKIGNSLQAVRLPSQMMHNVDMCWFPCLSGWFQRKWDICGIIYSICHLLQWIVTESLRTDAEQRVCMCVCNVNPKDVLNHTFTDALFKLRGPILARTQAFTQARTHEKCVHTQLEHVSVADPKWGYWCEWKTTIILCNTDLVNTCARVCTRLSVSVCVSDCESEWFGPSITKVLTYPISRSKAFAW